MWIEHGAGAPTNEGVHKEEQVYDDVIELEAYSSNL